LANYRVYRGAVSTLAFLTLSACGGGGGDAGQAIGPAGSQAAPLTAATPSSTPTPTAVRQRLFAGRLGDQLSSQVRAARRSCSRLLRWCAYPLSPALGHPWLRESCTGSEREIAVAGRCGGPSADQSDVNVSGRLVLTGKSQTLADRTPPRGSGARTVIVCDGDAGSAPPRHQPRSGPRNSAASLH
jgi:hypothetical protein